MGTVPSYGAARPTAASGTAIEPLAPGSQAADRRRPGIPQARVPSLLGLPTATLLAGVVHVRRFHWQLASRNSPRGLQLRGRPSGSVPPRHVRHLPNMKVAGGEPSSPPRWTATTAEEMRGRRPASSEISVAHASIRKGTRKTRAERAGSPNGRIAPLGLILCCGLARRTITVPAWPAPTLPINDTGWTARRRALPGGSDDPQSGPLVLAAPGGVCLLLLGGRGGCHRARIDCHPQLATCLVDWGSDLDRSRCLLPCRVSLWHSASAKRFCRLGDDSPRGSVELRPQWGVGDRRGLGAVLGRDVRRSHPRCQGSR